MRKRECNGEEGENQGGSKTNLLQTGQRNAARHEKSLGSRRTEIESTRNFHNSKIQRIEDEEGSLRAEMTRIQSEFE